MEPTTNQKLTELRQRAVNNLERLLEHIGDSSTQDVAETIDTIVLLVLQTLANVSKSEHVIEVQKLIDGRRPGTGRLQGRPLDDDGAIEFTGRAATQDDADPRD